MKKLFATMVVLASMGFVAACGSTSTTDGGTGGGTATGGGSGGGTADAGTGGGTGGGSGLSLGTSSLIFAYLDGKTFDMTGTNIPTEPNGFNENLNLGAATQCYNDVTITEASQNFTITSKLGTLQNKPADGSIVGGTCDRTTVSSTYPATSTLVNITNVKNNAECFDIDITFNGYGQEGRGSISADGKTLKLELYFSTQATNMRCADGNPGTTGVMLKGAAFTGNSVQTYVLKP
jgi:hypothetical protein